MAKVLLSIRLGADLMAALKSRAARENRTVSNLIETLLREAVLSQP